MRDRDPELRAAGIGVAVVGCGSAEQAGTLVRKLELPFPVFADSERRTFEAADLQRPMFGGNPLRSLGAAWRAFRSGARPDGIQGDPFQLGGTFVIAPGDRVLFEHRSAGAGDHAPWDEVIASIA